MELIFTGKIFAGGNVVLVGNKLLNTYSFYLNKSPSGFSWGYRGSGCQQLSFAILFEFAKNSGIMKIAEFAQEHMTKFTEDFISRIPQECAWEITSENIRYWFLEGQRLEMYGGEKVFFS